MSKAKIIIDPQPRTVDLIFDAKAQTQLCNLADLTVFDAGPMSTEMLEEALPEAEIIIGQTDLPRERLDSECPYLASLSTGGGLTVKATILWRLSIHPLRAGKET